MALNIYQIFQLYSSVHKMVTDYIKQVGFLTRSNGWFSNHTFLASGFYVWLVLIFTDPAYIIIDFSHLLFHQKFFLNVDGVLIYKVNSTKRHFLI